MDKSKLIIPASIIIGFIVLGGFFYFSNLNRQLIRVPVVIENEKDDIKEGNNEDEFAKKMECKKYSEKIEEKIKEFNIMQKPEIRDSSPNIESTINHLYIENNALKEVFYSPKLDSCLYVESKRTLMKSDPNANPNIGEWNISYETYYLIDALSGKEIDFNDGLPFLQMIHRGERFNSEDYANELINIYK